MEHYLDKNTSEKELISTQTARPEITDAEFEAYTRDDYLIAPPSESDPHTVWLVDDVRGWSRHVHPILLKALPRLAKWKEEKVIAWLKGHALDCALQNLSGVRSRWRFEEHIELAMDCAACSGLLKDPARTKLQASIAESYLRQDKKPKLSTDPMLGWLQLYRFAVQTGEFKERLRLRAKTMDRARQQIFEYTNRLFQKHARMLVIRVDLAYREKYSSSVTIDEAKGDLRHFLTNIRASQKFDANVGYIWRLEDGDLAGYHFHVVFFLDGSRVQQDSHYAQVLGEYWVNSITNGRGRYWNCNASPKPHLRDGIGMIEHGDAEKRTRLGKALDYITKSSQTVLVRSGRSMGHGQLVDRPLLGPGRPRIPAAETESVNTSPTTYLPEVVEQADGSLAER